MGAKEIGIAYHGTTDANGNYINNPISKPLQLTLHATTGCALGSQSRNCDAGAAGAVAGELIAENYFKNKLEENGAIIQGNEVIIDQTKTNLTLNEVQQFKNTAVELAKIGGAVAAVLFAGADNSANAINIGAYAGGNSAVNNSIYLGGKYKMPASELIPGQDYDVHAGIQGTAVHISASLGSDGFGLSADANPTIGLGIYGNIIPHGEEAAFSVTQGVKNRSSFGFIVTQQENLGLTGSYGLAIPLSPSRTNLNIPISLDK